MAYLLQPDYVQYTCSCGKLKPITNIYFCRHCLKIRCGFCICHEVDSHYCANCLENMPSSEARLKKNRCSSCFDCPSCFHSLSTRSTIVQQAKPTSSEGGDTASTTKTELKAAKKMYYLSCFNCRWTSRDVGIPDQPVATGGWPERFNVYSQRVNAVQDYFKTLALQEKQEKLERERKKFAIRGKYITLTDKIGLTGAMARSLAGMAEGATAQASAGFAPAVPSQEIDDLPDDIFTKEIKLNEVTTMEQRLAAVTWQPTNSSQLQPQPRHLAAKRSQRCRHCDHNVTKPEYNPGSIKFKIELLAYYHIPEVRLISYEPVKVGRATRLLLRLSNPTGHEMALKLLPPPTDEERLAELAVEQSHEQLEVSPTSLSVGTGVSLMAGLRPGALAPARGAPPVPPTVLLTVPSDELRLPQRDDASEYDDDQHNYNDDPSLVLWRKSNKLALKLEVTGLSEATAGTDAVAALRVSYAYTNTVPGADRKQPQHHRLTTTLYLHMGRLHA